MKKIFTHSDSAQVGLCKSLLDDAGIACYVSDSTGLLVSVLCLVNDADYDRAKAIVDSYRSPLAPSGGDWTCPQCQSVVPAAFDSCWKCEHARPGPPN
jgi:hypothetical protein